MPPLTESVSKPQTSLVSWAALVVSAIALVSTFVSSRPRPIEDGKEPSQRQSRLQMVNSRGVLRVGYGGYPPYTIIDPKSTDPDKRVTGFSVDLVKEIAARAEPPLRIEWVKLNWDTLKADILADKFDFIADPVFQTVPRALEFSPAEPYSYFGIAAAVVRKGERRFQSFKDLDRPGVKISLAEGWTSTEFAKKHLTKPEFKMVTVSGEAFNQLDEVLLGRSDVALNDVPTVIQYVKAHKDRVQALWVDRPPATVPGGFLTRREDQDLRLFLDSAVRIARADGVLERLDAKWKTYGYFPSLELKPGSGIRASIVPTTTRP